MDNRTECKMLFRKIQKMTHPDNYYSVKEAIPKGVEVYLASLRNEALEAFDNDDVETLKRIIAELNGEVSSDSQKESNKKEKTSNEHKSGHQESTNHQETRGDLSSYFKKMGLEVIDNRKKGGALWVIGSEQEIGHIVEKAIKQFQVSGKYSKGGRTTKHRPAWWTSDNK